MHLSLSPLILIHLGSIPHSHLRFELFRTFGTHTIQHLTVGGKVIYTRYLSTEQLSARLSDNVKASVNAGVRTISVEAGIEASFSLSRDSSNQSSSTTSGSQINVMGGSPVGDASTMEGFAKWGSTVDKNPMPVSYGLAPFSDLAEPLMDEYSRRLAMARRTPSMAESRLVETAALVRGRGQCSRACYTIAKSEQIVEAPLSWVARCAWTEPDCRACPECSEPPPSLPNSPMPPAMPPAMSPATPHPTSASYFRAAFQLFFNRYSNADLQGAFLDASTNILTLGGGQCQNNPRRGNAMVERREGISWRNQDSWNTLNDEQLRLACFRQCFNNETKSQAMEFRPPNAALLPHGHPPACTCVTRCPRIEYMPDSLDETDEELFNIQLTIRCTPYTTHLCSLSAYTPWPTPFTVPPPPLPPAPAPPPSVFVPVKYFPVEKCDNPLRNLNLSTVMFGSGRFKTTKLPFVEQWRRAQASLGFPQDNPFGNNGDPCDRYDQFRDTRMDWNCPPTRDSAEAYCREQECKGIASDDHLKVHAQLHAPGTCLFGWTSNSYDEAGWRRRSRMDAHVYMGDYDPKFYPAWALDEDVNGTRFQLCQPNTRSLYHGDQRNSIRRDRAVRVGIYCYDCRPCAA